MTVKRQKIRVDLELTAEKAVNAYGKFTKSEKDAKKAGDEHNETLVRLRREYQRHQARLANAKDRLAAFTTAQERAAAAARKHAAAQKKLGKSWRGFSPQVVSAAKNVVRYGKNLGVMAVAVGGAAVATSFLGRESLALQNIFKNLPFSLNAARAATRGLADDETLARNAIMANQAGVATSAKAYGELVGMAQTLALKMGRDVNETVERVTLGIAKQEREILDELVILPRMNDMWKQYAEQLGKTTAELSDHEKNAAFTESAIEAMRKATQGVEVDMDGAAAAIARTTVEVKNLRTAALGGSEVATSLRDGVAQLDGAILRQIHTMDTYGSSAWQVRDALEGLGVELEDFRGHNVSLQKELERLVHFQAKALVRQADRKQLTTEHIAEIDKMLMATGALSEVDEKVLRIERERLVTLDERAKAEVEAQAEARRRVEAELVDVENSLAFARASQAEQSTINELVQREAELRAQVADAMGDQAKAAEIRRKAELASFRALGELAAPKKRRGGGRRRKRDDSGRARADFLNGQQARIIDLQQARFAAQLQERRDRDPFSDENLDAQLANVIDFEERKAQLTLAARLRGIEEMRAAGADPVSIVEAESAAQVEALETQREAAEARFQRELALASLKGELSEERALQQEREMTMAEFADRIEGQRHAAAMARVAERQRTEEEAHERKVAIARESTDMVLGSAQAIVQAAVIEGKALKGVVASHAKSEAMRHGLILGPSAFVQAGFHALTGNLPLAAAMGTQAAKHFAFAGVMAGIGGAAGAFGGVSRGSGSEGFGPANFGGGDQRAANDRGGSGAGFDIGGQVPISADASRRVNDTAAVPSGGSVTTINVDMRGMTVGGAFDERSAMGLEKAATQAGRKLGKLAAGGIR